MKTREREEARRIRRDEGAPLKEIARRLGVAVSSVSVWVRDIDLSPEQHAALQARNPIYNGQLLGQRIWAERCRAVRAAAQQRGRERARAKEPLFVAGCMLFWAEGSKARNHAQLTNADPDLVRLFVRFLRECFGVEDVQIRVTCNLFADHLPRQREVEQFWLNVLELPRASLCKSIVNVYSKYSQKKRQNRLPYGTCRVTVHDTGIVQTLYGAIQELGGFDRPAWLA